MDSKHPGGGERRNSPDGKAEMAGKGRKNDERGIFSYRDAPKLNLAEDQPNQEEFQEHLLDLMYMHQNYHSAVRVKQYANRGSKLVCTRGTKPAQLDTLEDHGVYLGTVPVMTCMDCRKGNIHDFDSCMCPEATYVGRLPMAAPAHPDGKPASQAPWNRFPHICVPLISPGDGWYQADTGLFIEEAGGMSYQALREDAFLVCQYGGVITISEVTEKTEENSTAKEYVTLELLNKLGWKKIQCGYRKTGSQEASPIDDMESEIERMHRNIEQEKDVDKINYLFEKYEINTKERICAFFAECSAETSNGLGLIERAVSKGDAKKLKIQYLFDMPSTRENLKQWFDDNRKYKYLYRGGGVIQLTWDYHYKEFKEWMKDEFGIDDDNILDLGAEYVASAYPWESGVFFWDKNDLNTKADSISSLEEIDKVTNVVNYYMSAGEKKLRKDAYEKWLAVYPE